jgi:hypothetical protein
MTLKGTVSDAMCGAKHPVADAAGCTKDCVKKGSDYALMVKSVKMGMVMKLGLLTAR